MTITDPAIIIQGAVVAALKVAAPLVAFIMEPDGTARVYDRVPRGADGEPLATFPYVTFGEIQILPELYEATDATRCVVTLHAWSRAVGAVECRKICGAISNALHDAALQGVQEILLRDSRVIGDPDGLTSHGIINFDLLTDANLEG